MRVLAGPSACECSSLSGERSEFYTFKSVPLRIFELKLVFACFGVI